MSGVAALKPATLVWMASASVSSEADLQTWLANIEALDPATRDEVLDSVEGGRAAMHVANGFYLAEYVKPKPERDWNRALSLLDVMERSGREFNLEPIWGAAIALRVSIVGGMLGKIEAAREIAEAVLTAPGITPRTRFRVRVSLGLAHLDLNQTAEARVWMEAARLDGAAAPPFEAVDLLLRFSKITGEIEGSAVEALEIVEEASRIATAAGRMPNYLEAKVAGELAIARWCACCDDTVRMVEGIACESCDVTVLDMRDPAVAKRARELGVRSVPAVAVDGVFAGCCSGRGPVESDLRAAGLGAAS